MRNTAALIVHCWYGLRLELIERMILVHMRQISKGKYQPEDEIVKLAEEYAQVQHLRAYYMAKLSGHPAGRAKRSS